MLASLSAGARRFDRWIDGPASLVADAGRAMRPGRRVRLQMSADGTTVRANRVGKGNSALTLDLASDGVGAAMESLVAGQSVSIEIPGSWLIERRLELPIEAAPHLDGIVASRLNALSPVPVADILFGHRTLEIDRDTRKMRLAVAILPKARVAQLLDLMERAGARDVEIVTHPAGGGSVVLLPRRSGTRGRNRLAKAALTLLLAGSVTAAIVVLIARPIIAESVAERRAALEARGDAARQVILDATAPAQTATLPEQAALQIKTDAVSALGALDDLAAALPLNAHATEISLAQGLIRIAGRTTDLPAVLTALESSGRFADSRLLGTAQKLADGVTSDFIIQTRPLIRTGGELK